MTAQKIDLPGARHIMAIHVEANYVLGHSDGELERLRRRANLIDPITRQFMQQIPMSFISTPIKQ
jgi:hypothetical protein